jgi:hypothetical protein
MVASVALWIWKNEFFIFLKIPFISKAFFKNMEG